MTIKVIGVGFGRTGTASLRSALEILGFNKCYHMYDIVFSDRSMAKTWHNANKGQNVDWDEVFDGYQATVDWPGLVFYKELVGKYPDSKVILTIREPDKWYESMYNTIYTLHMSIPKWLLWVSAKDRNLSKMVYSLIWDGTFNGKFTNKEYAKEVFKKHIEDVKISIPKDRLLTYQISEGWEPLCKFLGVSIPEDKPFPNVNDTEEFKNVVNKLVLVTKAQYIVPLVIIFLLLFYIIR